jgi:hypothetical protein
MREAKKGAVHDQMVVGRGSNEYGQQTCHPKSGCSCGVSPRTGWQRRQIEEVEAWSIIQRVKFAVRRMSLGIRQWCTARRLWCYATSYVSIGAYKEKKV